MWTGEGECWGHVAAGERRPNLTEWKISPGGWRTEWRGRCREAKFISGMRSKEIHFHDALLDHTFCVAQLGFFLKWGILIAHATKDVQIIFIVFLFLQVKCLCVNCVYMCIHIHVYMYVCCTCILIYILFLNDFRMRLPLT